MRKVFDFSGKEKCELIIQNTWAEFRNQLAVGNFQYDDLDTGLQTTFLKVFDDLFQHTHRFLEKRIADVLMADTRIVRAARLKPGMPIPDYDRFIPNAKFIKNDNRFSPPGIEWLYLSFASEDTRSEAKKEEKCALKECRAQNGEIFALCNFKIDDRFKDALLIDLTISKEANFSDINVALELAGEEITNREVIKGCVNVARGFAPKSQIEDVIPAIEKWAVFTYAKLLAEQIFLPLTTEDKRLMYAPFQCIAQYFLSKGYTGIVYSSTVFPEGKNVVLFDKTAAYPQGAVRKLTISSVL